LEMLGKESTMNLRTLFHDSRLWVYEYASCESIITITIRTRYPPKMLLTDFN